MSKRILALMTMVALVSIALVACGGGAEPAPAAPQRTSPPVVPPANSTAPAPGNTGGTSGGGTPVTVSLQDPGGSGSYKFDSSEFTFSAGETVSFTFNSELEFHTFTVDDLDIDVSVDGGASETLTFTFDKPGEYKIICIPHEALGMVGTITVN